MRGSQAVVFPCLLMEGLFDPAYHAESPAPGECLPVAWDEDLRCKGDGDRVLHPLHNQGELCSG